MTIHPKSTIKRSSRFGVTDVQQRKAQTSHRRRSYLHQSGKRSLMTLVLTPKHGASYFSLAPKPYCDRRSPGNYCIGQS